MCSFPNTVTFCNIFSDVITVDDLSTSQIKRLRIYLQAVLDDGDVDRSTPTVQQGEPVPQATVKAKENHDGDQTTPGQVDDILSDSFMEQMLRKFTEQSMKQGNHCCAY